MFFPNCQMPTTEKIYDIEYRTSGSAAAGAGIWAALRYIINTESGIENHQKSKAEEGGGFWITLIITCLRCPGCAKITETGVFSKI